MSRTELPLPPGRSGLPFLGETIPFLLNTESFVRHKLNKYGRIYKSHILGKPSVVLNGVDAMKFLAQNQGRTLISTYPKSVIELLGPNVLPNSDGPTHERARQVIGKAFTPSAVASYSQYIEQVCVRYAQKWRTLGGEEGGGGEFEMRIYGELLDVMLDIAYFVLIGDNMDGEQLELYSKWFGDIQGAFFSLPYSWFPPFRRAMKSRTNLVNALKDLIAKRRRLPRQGRDALNLLIDSKADDGTALSDDDLAAQMIMLLIAGHETSASAATCFLMEVARREDLRVQLVEEQVRAMEGGDPLSVQLQSMPLLEQALQESLRLYPPASGVIRESVCEFEHEGFRVPAGYQVLFGIFLTNRLEELSPSGEDFCPFASQSKASQHYSFGAGPHLCIGQRLALLELKIFLSIFLRTFDFSAVEGQDFSLTFIPMMKPKDGLLLRMKERAAG
ncbi:cytochrome P450 [Guillardia theta CCMP2712]|uniref:Cytochrome P450 n=2 Tax=Guillardia theta TaxID=55529 RepID=L1JSH9_GUITC|nr:cytochrome P450 [Guillardia theta CCMP2712]EKX51145.1 cytochrome P450 [Guillardia theta CCMP2712]|eukprot:XP_005838125.1 cytochrome P450 [Guillardia theta CCMP2712]